MRIGDKLLAKTANVEAKRSRSSAPGKTTAPKTSPGRLLDVQGRIVAAETRADELEACLGQAIELPLNDIHEVPGRQRKLTSEQFQELKDNLARNPLVTPISVARCPEGNFELIAGHNRLQAYRELGKKTIPAIIREFNESEIDLVAFYSNLLSPALPDLEKYLGFKKRQEQTGFDQVRLAVEAGISEAQISRLFSYDRLPTEALTLLKQHSDLNRLGSNAAEALARLAVDNKASVIAAIKRLVEDPDFTQKQAITLIQAANKKQATPASKEQVIRTGRIKFCSIKSRSKTLAVQFKDAGTASEWIARIAKFIQDELKN